MLINQKKGGRYLAVPKKSRKFAATIAVKQEQSSLLEFYLDCRVEAIRTM